MLPNTDGSMLKLISESGLGEAVNATCDREQYIHELHPLVEKFFTKHWMKQVKRKDDEIVKKMHNIDDPTETSEILQYMIEDLIAQCIEHQSPLLNGTIAFYEGIKNKLELMNTLYESRVVYLDEE